MATVKIGSSQVLFPHGNRKQKTTSMEQSKARTTRADRQTIISTKEAFIEKERPRLRGPAEEVAAEAIAETPEDDASIKQAERLDALTEHTAAVKIKRKFRGNLTRLLVKIGSSQVLFPHGNRKQKTTSMKQSEARTTLADRQTIISTEEAFIEKERPRLRGPAEEVAAEAIAETPEDDASIKQAERLDALTEHAAAVKIKSKFRGNLTRLLNTAKTDALEELKILAEAPVRASKETAELPVDKSEETAEEEVNLMYDFTDSNIKLTEAYHADQADLNNQQNQSGPITLKTDSFIGTDPSPEYDTKVGFI